MATGCVVERWKKGEKDSRKRTRYALVIDLGIDPTTKKRKSKWVTFRADPRLTKQRERRQAADAKLAELIVQFNGDKYIDPVKLTLTEWLAQWLEAHAKPPAKRQATYLIYQRAIARVAAAPLGSLPLGRVRTLDVETFLRDVKGADATVRIHRQVLNSALKTAAKHRMIDFNPVTNADHVKGRSSDHGAETQCWTRDEARTFIDAAVAHSPQAGAFFALALDSGARRGELFGLRWADVDLDAGTINIERQLAENRMGEKGNRAPLLGPTKSEKSRRRVKVSPRTLALLKAHKVRQAEVKMANRTSYDDRGFVFAKLPEDLQTPSAKLGDPMLGVLNTRIFLAVIKAAGIRRIRFHGLRHTCVTLLLNAGTPVHKVSKRVGHATATMTLNTYAHALPTEQDDEAATMGTALFGG